MREIGQVVESVQTADEVMRQAEKHGIELPITSGVRSTPFSARSATRPGETPVPWARVNSITVMPRV